MIRVTRTSCAYSHFSELYLMLCQKVKWILTYQRRFLKSKRNLNPKT